MLQKIQKDKALKPLTEPLGDNGHVQQDKRLAGIMELNRKKHQHNKIRPIVFQDKDAGLFSLQINQETSLKVNGQLAILHRVQKPNINIPKLIMGSISEIPQQVCRCGK